MTGTSNEPPVDRASLGLGVATMAGSVFALSTGGPAPIDIAHLRTAGVLVLAVLGLVAVVGAVVRRPPLVWAAGIALVGAAVVQLGQLGPGANWLGNGSAVSLMGGLGLGLVAVGLTDPFRRTSR